MVMLRDAYRTIRGVTDLDVMDVLAHQPLGSALRGGVHPRQERDLARVRGVAGEGRCRVSGLWAQQELRADAHRDVATRAPDRSRDPRADRGERDLDRRDRGVRGPEKMLLRFFEAMVGTTPADADGEPAPGPRCSPSATRCSGSRRTTSGSSSRCGSTTSRGGSFTPTSRRARPRVDERAAPEAIARSHGGRGAARARTRA